MTTTFGNTFTRVLTRRIPLTSPPATARAAGTGSADIAPSTVTLGRSTAHVTPRATASGAVFDNSPVAGFAGVVRWIFFDDRTGEYWMVYLNPNEMTAPPASRDLKRGITTRGADRMASFETPVGIQDWSFSGVLLTQAHYRELERWAHKPGITLIRDHLGHYHQVILTGFTPAEKAGRASNDWKMKYTMNTQYLRRVR